jgi:hypothetical protein
MSVSARHPQISENTKPIENNDNISADRREQRETSKQTEKSSSFHTDIDTTEPERKPFSRTLNAYLKDTTTRASTKTTTLQRPTLRQLQRKKSFDDNTINT